MFLYEKSTGRIREEETVVKPVEGQVGWLHLDKPAQDVLRDVLTTFKANRLVERAVPQNGRPRIMMFQDHAYLSFYGFRKDWSPFKISILIGKTFLVTMSEEKLPFLEEVRQRLRDEPEKMDDSGAILYLVLDSLVERYLGQVDEIADEIQRIERQVFDRPFDNETGHRLFDWKRQLHHLRGIVEEEHSIVLTLADPDFPYWEEGTDFYFQDLDHSFGRVIAAFDQFKEEMGGIFDLQMSLKSDHMNVIMKTLTLVSAVFLPITFLAGLYGMNFEYMPELTWKYSYFVLVGVMATVAITLMTYFKKKGWW